MLLLVMAAVIGLLVLMGLGNNNRLGDSLQPKYTKTMDNLQEKQDERIRARALETQEQREVRTKNIIGVIIVIVLLSWSVGKSCG